MKKKSNIQFDSPDRLNIIVEGSKVIGDMITESNLRIDGEVRGNVSSVSKVVIGKTGIILGNLTCSDADIEGNIIDIDPYLGPGVNDIEVTHEEHYHQQNESLKQIRVLRKGNINSVVRAIQDSMGKL